jgi:hypothetical protein
MTKDALAEVTDDPKDEVPRLRYLRHKEEKTIGEPPEREPVYETIPRDRWERIEGANEAFTQIREKVRAETRSSGVDVWVTTHPTMERAVKVEYIVTEMEDTYHKPDIGYERLSGMLPSEVDVNISSNDIVESVPVKVIKKTQEPEAMEPSDTGYYYDYNYNENYDGVPAGSAIETTSDGSISRGTIGTPAYSDSIDGEALVTAAHLMTDSGEEDIAPDTSISQPTDSVYKIGELNEWMWDYDVNCRIGSPGDPDSKCSWNLYDDAAVIELNDYNDIDVKYSRASDSGGYMGDDVDGIVAWTTIEDKAGDTSYELSKQGATTGRGDGTIHQDYDPEYKRFFMNGIQSEGGDSGGPVVEEWLNYSLVAGIHVGSRGDRGPYCMSMEDIEFSLNVVV